MDIIKKVENSINKGKLLKRGETVVVGVSGGPDSVCLTHLFWRLREKYRLQIILAHLNHKIRKEAKKDAQLVKDYAEKLGFPLVREEIDVPSYAKRRKIGLEEAGREVRLEFFTRVARKVGAGKIALAHHRDDQAETVLMWILRGTGLKGLGGIAPLREEGKLKIIHPLLEVSKKEIKYYLKEENILFRVDRSNLKNAYFRNKIRGEIIPYLEQYSPRLKEHLVSLSQIVGEENEFLDRLTRQVYKKSVRVTDDKKNVDFSSILCYNNWLKRRVLREVLGTGFPFKKLEEILDLTKNKEIGLPGGWRAEKQGKKLVFFKSAKLPGIKQFKYRLPVPGTKEIKELGIILKTRVYKRPARTVLAENKLFFDRDKVQDALYIRNRRPGDRFYPLGLAGNKKIKELFIEKKIPVDQRDRVGLVLDGEKIIGVSGIWPGFWIGQISEEVKIDKGTKKVLEIEIKNSR